MGGGPARTVDLGGQALTAAELTPSLHRVRIRDSSADARLRKCTSKVVEG